MIIFMIVLEIIIFALGVFFLAKGLDEYDGKMELLGIVLIFVLFILPIAFGMLHGYIDYKESNDKDLARITAVTQEQDMFKTYYIVQVEYLTNTPQQEGMIQNNRIEQDTFYCYYEDKELVEQLKSHLYEELWIISGYKGGYETYKDFGTKLIKGIEEKGN